MEIFARSESMLPVFLGLSVAGRMIVSILEGDSLTKQKCENVEWGIFKNRLRNQTINGPSKQGLIFLECPIGHLKFV